MADVHPQSPPEWQTDELQDEWPSDDGGVEEPDTSSLSLTEPLESHIRTLDHNRTPVPEIPSQVSGTFLVRHDVQAAPIWPQSPMRKVKNGVKDFFSPLALERLFEPPSPPIESPTSAQNRGPTSHVQPSHGMIQDHSPQVKDTPLFGHNCNASRFTFTVPHGASPSTVPPDSCLRPQAESTPGHIYAPNAATSAPATDPRLRLFRFQYDTFTREHLSALVDSIAINSSSTGSGTPSSHFCRVNSDDPPDLRSQKRIKLSPTSDYDSDGSSPWAANAGQKTRKDYLRESRSLMQQIRRARDFPTISTVVSDRMPPSYGHDPDHNCHSPEPPFRNTSPTSGQPRSPNFDYRQQAAELMAQIKNDMHAEKRIFSGDTEVPLSSHQEKTYVPSSPSNAKSATSPSAEKENRGMNETIPSPKPVQKQKNPSSKLRIKTSTQKLSQLAVGRNENNITDDLSKIPMQTIQVMGVTVPHISISQLPPTGTSTAAAVAQPGPAPRNEGPSRSPMAVRVAVEEDANRLVSSSTASGTTLTAGSTKSFAKHPGPGQMRRIAPGDLPTLPERVGRMVFDKGLMKWVKATAKATAGMSPSEKREHVHGPEASADSEDPFKDIESLPDSKVAERSVQREEGESKVDAVGQDHSDSDGDEMEMSSFTFNDRAPGVAQATAGIEDMKISRSDDEQPKSSNASKPRDKPSPLKKVSSLPAIASRAKVITPVRPALKSALVTPVSGQKGTTSAVPSDQTPTSRRVPRRSVSFSDGKREGQIRGLGRNADRVPSSQDSDSFEPSARSKRIADMIDALDDSDSDEIDSPLKMCSSSHPPGDGLQTLDVRIPDAPEDEDGDAEVNRGKLSRSLSHRPPTGTDTSGVAGANATFLTECSFGVARDRLVQVITDVQPFEPHWEDLASIDLSDKKLESVARLKEFLPRVEEINLNLNQIGWLSGLPSTVRTLSIASNCLTGLTSFGQWHNLERLDISHNDLDSLRQLECLRHLQELRADGNNLGSLEGLETMRSLVKLSTQANHLREIDLNGFQWSKLQMLNLSENRLNRISGLGTLSGLISMNLDRNCLETLEAGESMPKLRILRVSGNKLQEMDVGWFPNLRTLYGDENRLLAQGVKNAGRLSKMENLSLRSQGGRGGVGVSGGGGNATFNLSCRDVRDVKRLYLSGNPLKSGFIEESCYNLVYMELAACRLKSLPGNLARLAPNLRTVNLNYNFLEEVKALEGLTRLAKLTIVGSRLSSTKAMIRVLQGLPELEVLDLRMNPFTLGWYLPVLMKEAGEEKKRGGMDEWQEMDAKFRRDLPDEGYLGRLAYRGLIMRACGQMKRLDGIEITEKERTKALHVLAGIARKKKRDGLMG